MKFGLRTPSLKKSISARTTGRAKRAVKKALIPGYGKKGMGWLKNPKKAAYNKIYNKTSFSLSDLFKQKERPSISKRLTVALYYFAISQCPFFLEPSLLIRSFLIKD